MGPTTRPTTYQDVKATLHWYMAMVALFASLVVYLVVLPQDHRDAFAAVFEALPGSNIIGSGVAVVLFGLAAWFLIFWFEAHDKFYDRYIIRWRYFYDIDFLLPKLYRPFSAELDPKFWDAAASKPYEFTKPFYEFVGDSAVTKINENLIVRFYERITKYWITQINELVLAGVLLVTFGYLFVYVANELAVTPLLILNFIIIGLFVLNRWLVRASRNQVRRATAEEIEDIHRSFRQELRQELQRLHKEEGLTFGEEG